VPGVGSQLTVDRLADEVKTQDDLNRLAGTRLAEGRRRGRTCRRPWAWTGAGGCGMMGHQVASPA
jgi:hypothetical protein